MDENAIIKMYVDGKGSPTIAKKFDTNFREILKILKRNNIQLRSARESAKKTTFDENFFENIDTEEKAYFLGFILADGSIDVKHNRLKIAISHKDVNLLEQFNRIMNSDVKIRTYSQTRGFSSADTKLSELTFVSPKIISDLYKLGIGGRKTFTVIPPIIEESIEHHFWRGVMDGDGHVSLSNKKNPNRVGSIEFGICGNMRTMSSLSLFLSKNNVDHKITPDKSIYRIRVCNRRALIILDVLYTDSTVFLNRKKHNYIQYKQMRSDADLLISKTPGIKHIKSGKYTSSSLISLHGFQKHIGTFETLEEAITAQNNFNIQLP